MKGVADTRRRNRLDTRQHATQNNCLNFAAFEIPEDVLGHGICALILQIEHVIHHTRSIDNLTTDTQFLPT